MSRPASPKLFPSLERRPYYIYAPEFTRMSAGIKVLHLLCHALNSIGESAFITTSKTHPSLLTPVLTDEIVSFHFDKGLTPIVVYPEIVFGNPLAAPMVVRYLLNFPGLISGQQQFDSSEICFGYSAELVATQSADFKNNVLFIPASDTSVFNDNGANRQRQGTCFYAGKYRDVHHGELFEVTRNSIEIYGPLNKQNKPQTQEEIAAIFRSSELFYCYENTALAIEAALCGCPTVFLPNPYLTQKIGSALVGDDGIAWGNSADEVARAKATVGKFQENYRKLIDGFWLQLEHFVMQTQTAARSTNYSEKVKFQAGGGIGMADVAAPPKKPLGKLISVALTLYRLMTEEGPILTARMFWQGLRTEGVQGIKRQLKAAYFKNRSWIRSQLD